MLRLSRSISFSCLSSKPFYCSLRARLPDRLVSLLLSVLILFAPACSAQGGSDNPFVEPIQTDTGVVVVDYVEFARIPDAGNGLAPRLMHMLATPDGSSLMVSTMQGKLYRLSNDGKSITEFLNIAADRWAIPVQSAGSERGLQSFAFHPQFNEPGSPGYGRFYTYLDTADTDPEPDFESGGSRRSHDTVLLEWTASDPDAAVYEGDAPRELFRAAQPFPNHNGGQVAFNPVAAAGDEDYGLLYIGLADGGSGGDPLGSAQNLGSAFGKILRIDPLGSDSVNQRYGIPPSNPFTNDGDPQTLGEIYAYGVRNPQRFNWDPQTGRMLLADIGQNQVEEISPVTAGANLGWNLWEGSFRYVDRQVSLDSPRSAPGLTWPVAEYDHRDPLWRQRQVAVTGVAVFRGDAIPQLRDKIVFGDNPNGELFYVAADTPANGGQQQIRRILLNDNGTARPFWELVKASSRAQGRDVSEDTDLRFGLGRNGELFLLNKRDGLVRKLLPAGTADH
ncbi:MAG: PQQ-dependent sugar dehydrogenase [Gammaproteobacteria bacterium]|nr:PQQ-dependent sugar dehydrogenase [Pseudomonadales bacterium]MCP5348998.1 PQQ-dependent sugar dehydrogenase [Pseudomonadales bacterium]